VRFLKKKVAFKSEQMTIKAKN